MRCPVPLCGGMSTARELIEQAFERLSLREGYVDRPDQKQLALLLSDLIAEGSTGAFEAPTGLGKSLAALVPAIAHAVASNKRTVIATYTNVLAEQYWRHDLPLALSLFEDAAPKCQFLIGRQRYACLAAMDEHAADSIDDLLAASPLGIETEFREALRLPARELTKLWQAVATPAVCPGRLCEHYNACYYYRARRSAERAELIITNHSVVIQDALMSKASEDGVGMLGNYDFLILDEAHDFAQAAQNGLEFELSATKLAALSGIATRLESTLRPLAQLGQASHEWAGECERFRQAIAGCQREIAAFGLSLGQPGILGASPAEVQDHPQVKARTAGSSVEGARRISAMVAEEMAQFARGVDRRLEEWRDAAPETGRMATETVRNYTTYIRDYGAGSESLFAPEGVSVSYVGRTFQDPILRHDVIGLAEPLSELLWDKRPWACMSATLAVDGAFDYFQESTGARATFQEALPTPFDFSTQAAVYVPPLGAVPDPTIARKEGTEDAYHRAVAAQLQRIIEVAGGRTLALFHSRKEMEAVASYVNLPRELPILMQLKSGAGSVGAQFIQSVSSSLFALRSFWTGFDAPGETLSCVVLVRVPFEVLIDPPQIARLAWLQGKGVDPFAHHTLPLAKMLIRQGAGRLIRRSEDKGVIALLDPRLRTKRYGEEILANLPSGMREFANIEDAVGWVGL